MLNYIRGLIRTNLRYWMLLPENTTDIMKGYVAFYKQIED